MTAITNITNPRSAAYLFIGALLGMYGCMPIVINIFSFENPYNVELAIICLVSCVGLAIGFKVPLFDHRFSIHARRLVIDYKVFHLVIWLAFLVFMAVTFLTAESIPIISAFKGLTMDALDQQRGAFLKGRTGIEMLLPYMSSFFMCTLLPYSLVSLFIDKNRYRFVLMGIFLIFSISFLQKALFLNLILPFIYFLSRRVKVSSLKIFYVFIGSLGLLYLITILAFPGNSIFHESEDGDMSEFFSAGYSIAGPLEFLVWRSIAVPIFTATDTLLVFSEKLSDQPLLGATSSFLSILFSMERINIERIVFAYQFGSWNDIANANAVFMVDAFVNFGWIGVGLFSFLVGQSLRWFWKSKDEAFRSLWTLYCFLLFFAPLIGMLLSNGYLYMFFHALFLKLKNKSLEVRSLSQNMPPLSV